MTVIITRPEPAASATAEKLRELGHEVIVSPVLKIVDTGINQPSGTFHGIIVTSANALNILQKRSTFENLLNLPVFAVGDATADKAKALGFKNVVSAGGSAKDLAFLIADHTGFLDGVNVELLYISGVDTTDGLVKSLRDHSIGITTWPVYKANKVDQLTKSATGLLISGSPCIVLLYSTRSARQFAMLADLLLPEHVFENIAFITISPKVSSALPDVFQSRSFHSEHPDEPSLFLKIKEYLSNWSR